MDASHLEGRLLFAIPKKGRLQEQTRELLKKCDIQYRRGERQDIALVTNHPIALIFLPAADIPTFVGEGRVDLGITGGDQVAEHDARLAHSRNGLVRSTSSDTQVAVSATNNQETKEHGASRHRSGSLLPGDERNEGVEKVLDLGFGACKLCVQVPEKGNLQTTQDLIGRDVVSSFVGLAEEFFVKLQATEQEKTSTLENGADNRTQHSKAKTRIKYVGGSVEAACALGVADGIVDLVESGETMRAAGLKSIHTVLSSTAVLIKSKRVSNTDLVEKIVRRTRGVIDAWKFTLLAYNISASQLPLAKKIAPGRRAPTIMPTDDPELVAVQVMVEKKMCAETMDELTGVGATDIMELEIRNAR